MYEDICAYAESCGLPSPQALPCHPARAWKLYMVSPKYHWEDHLPGCPQALSCHPPGPDSRKITCFDFTKKRLLFLLDIMIVMLFGA